MITSEIRRLPAASPADPSVRDLIAPIFRRKKLVGLVFGGVLLVAIVGAMIVSGLYETNMEILVNRQRQDPMVSAESIQQMPLATPPVTEEEINSEVELLQSEDLLRQVVLANGLQEQEKHSISGFLFSGQQPDWYVSKAVQRLAKKLNIAVVTKTNVIGVSYKSGDPQIACGVLKKLGELYMRKHLTVQRPSGSFDFFAKQTDNYKQALEGSEKRLASFGKDQGTVAPDVQRTFMAQQVVTFVANLHQAQQAIAADELRIADEESRLKTMPARSSTVEVSNDANQLLQQLQANLLAAQIKRTQLALKYDAKYPLVQEADQEIAQTQAAIADAKTTRYVDKTTDRDATYELLRQDAARTRADLASQKATAAALTHSIEAMQSQMVELDRKALQQADLIRETKADESNYLLYLSKREQERTSDALDQKRIGNVAIAVPPSIPILPAVSPVLVMLIGVFLASFAGVAAAFVAEYLDSSFRTPAEVYEVLRIPVLASFPKQIA
jgi:uncharacterized protein involved in exopolysaccharide biosynthesis